MYRLRPSLRVDVDSLQLVKECVRCSNGHRFCLKCLGVWALKQNQQNTDDFNDDDDDDDNSEWRNAIHPVNTSAVAIPSWLMRLQRFFFFPLINVHMVYRDPTQAASARHARLLNAIALPNVRYLSVLTMRHNKNQIKNNKYERTIDQELA